MNRSLNEWLRVLETRHPVAIDLGLERSATVFERLGSPRAAKTIITVGGTNGKGSTVAYLACLGRALDMRVGIYTSPHLHRFNERLVIDQEMVDDQSLVQAFEAVDQARGDISLTYFEHTTLACLWIMARRFPPRGLDLAVLEVGLGGRLDTVNVVDPDLAVITSVGLDHQEFLGTEREQIGAEKAGILRPGIDLVCGEASPPESVLSQAQRLGCQVFLPGRDYLCEPAGKGARFDMGAQRWTISSMPLPGQHQIRNLGAALAAACRALPGFGGKRAEQAVASLSQVRVPGRAQQSQTDPRVWLDVGHNPMAANALAVFLRSLSPAAVHCVLGMYADKDVEAVVAEFGAQVNQWYCAGLKGARGQDAKQLQARVRRARPAACVLAPGSVAEALASARSKAQDTDLILVFGSFVTVSEAWNALSEQDL